MKIQAVCLLLRHTKWILTQFVHPGFNTVHVRSSSWNTESVTGIEMIIQFKLLIQSIVNHSFPLQLLIPKAIIAPK